MELDSKWNVVNGILYKIVNGTPFKSYYYFPLRFYHCNLHNVYY